MSMPSRKPPEPSRADRNIAWIENNLFVPEGKYVGKPIVMREWQRQVIRGIYSPNTRRAIISFGRKNGKTALAACLLLLHLVGPEAKRNSQLFSAAQSREQASILFSLASKQVRMSPTISPYVVIRDSGKQLACPEIGTLYRALSADASTAYGLSPAFVVHDELGQVRGPKSELYEALETAAGAQEAPLSIVISTQAPTDADLLSLLIDDAQTGADRRTRLFLYSAPDALETFSEEAIKAANPAYGDFLSEPEVLSQRDTAKRMPSAEASYQNLILNRRVNATNPFISRATFDQGNRPVDVTVLGSKPVYVGLDLSSRLDLTALVSAAKSDNGEWHVRADFFAPLNGVEERSRRDRVPYDVWAKQGYLTLTPGDSVDYAFVAHKLCEIADECNLVEIAFDRWKIQHLQREIALLDRELPLVEFGQGFKDMSPALDVIESLFVEGRIIHGGNPILRMCFANAVVTKDPAGNRKLDKSKATGRIDGAVALAMGIGRSAVTAPEIVPSWTVAWM